MRGWCDTTNAMALQVIVFEGGEGAGKTTQVRRLASELRDEGRTVFVTGVFQTTHGKVVRRWLMDVEQVSYASLTTQVFVLGSAMNQMVDELDTAAADIALVDRFVYTTMAYHGGGLEMGIDAVAEIYAPITARCTPALVLCLDMPPHLIAARKPAGDRIEAKPIDFHVRVRDAYRTIMTRLPNARTIDAKDDEDAVHTRIVAAVREFIR